MKLVKYLLTSILFLFGMLLFSVVASPVNSPSPVGVVYAAEQDTNPALDQIMPNEKLQQLVLYNLEEQGLAPENAKLSDYTADSFKTALGKLTELEWAPRSHQDDPDYINLEPLNGGNGAINSSNHGNYSLEGLQYATSLTTLNLSMDLLYGHEYFRNDIQDITPLEHLTSLTSIDLHGNRIHDISPISKLPNVTSLDISYNSITDLSSLNSAQYTQQFNYAPQFILLPMQRLSGNSYNWNTPFVGKLPQGVTYDNNNVSALGVSGFVINAIDANQPANTKILTYISGTSPVPVQTNGSLEFTDLKSQLPGTTYNPWKNGMTVVPNDYTYYMIAQYKEGSMPPTFTEYIPYKTNVAQYNYQIQPVDKNGNNIPGYTPTTITGNQGDKVSVPTISGYTVNDSHVDSNQQIALPDGSSSSTTIIKVVYDANTVNYKILPTDRNGHSLGHEIDGEAIPGTKITVPDVSGYVINDSQVDSDNQVTIPASGGTITIIYDPTFANQTNVDIHYLDNNTGQLLQSKRIYGSKDDRYTVDKAYYPDTITINGQSYTLVKSKMPTNLTGTLTANTAPVIFYYQKTVTPPSPNPGPGPTPINPVNPTPTPKPNPTPQPDLPNYAAVKGEAVYSLKKIYLYKNANFKKSERRFGYVKKPRVNRPMFVVTGYKYDRQGKLRYHVRDVNHLSKTDGWTGYITADYHHVRPVYYHSSHKTLTVINPRGVNEYKNKNLTGMVKNFKQGQVLRVKGFVKHNLTTRYQLSNGHYITGNRKLVQMGKVKQPKRIVVKQAINRYQTANLTKRNGSFKKGNKITIKRYTFSDAASLTKTGMKRYVVNGGYITASPKYVKVYYK